MERFTSLHSRWQRGWLQKELKYRSSWHSRWVVVCCSRQLLCATTNLSCIALLLPLGKLPNTPQFIHVSHLLLFSVKHQGAFFTYTTLVMIFRRPDVCPESGSPPFTSIWQNICTNNTSQKISLAHHKIQPPCHKIWLTAPQNPAHHKMFLALHCRR